MRLLASMASVRAIATTAGFLALAASQNGCSGLAPAEDESGTQSEPQGIHSEALDCLHVAPHGNDSAAVATHGARPFRNLQRAIDYAAAHQEISTVVCVAAGQACGMTAEYPGPTNADLTLRDGIAVRGRYESTHWSRCTTSITRILPKTGLGVSFGPEITSGATLDGFEVVSAATATATSAVTVNGAQGVDLVDITVPERTEWPVGGPVPLGVYGVLANAGSDLTIEQSDIFASAGTEQAMGILTFDARLVVENSKVRSFSPRESIAIEVNGTERTRIAHNVVAASAGNDSSGLVWGIGSGGYVQELEVVGNAVSARGEGQAVTGLSLNSIYPTGITATDNHVAVEGMGDATAVASASGGLVLDSNAIEYGSHGPGRVVGIECGTSFGEFGLSGCAQILRNTVTGTAFPICNNVCQLDSAGLFVIGVETLVDGNEFHGGCGDGPNGGTAFGVSAGGNVRLVNNTMIGGFCEGSPRVTMAGLAVSPQFFGTVDVSSNRIDGGVVTGGACRSAGIYTAGLSTFIRNNIIAAGSCSTASNVYQPSNDAPLALENNDFAPSTNAFLYSFGNGNGSLGSIGQVNTLPGSSGNLSAGCSTPLAAGSPCIDAGTPASAPDHDKDGEPRNDGIPDIGPDEFHAGP
jgi:hypothetical protein